MQLINRLMLLICRLMIQFPNPCFGNTWSMVSAFVDLRGFSDVGHILVYLPLLGRPICRNEGSLGELAGGCEQERC